MNGLEDEFNNTLGCLFFVGLFSVMLYGITCGQIMYYFTHYYLPGDHAYITVLVVILWLFDTAKTMIDIACGWDLIILDHGNVFSLLGRIPTMLPGDFIASSLTIYVVHCCYLHTIWMFLRQHNRNGLWPLFMVPAFLLVSGSFAAALVGTVQVWAALFFVVQTASDIQSSQFADNIFEGVSNAKLAGTIRPVSAAVVDIYITAWLCYHLHDSKTGHAESDSMVAKLVNYAITRGIVTSASQVAAFILFLVDYPRKTLWFLLLYIPASTLYVNSLFAMWNARRHIMSASAHPTTASSLSTWQINVNTILEVPEDQQDSP